MDLVVGRVARPHGIRGELLVDVRTDEPDLRFAAGSVFGATYRDGRRGTLVVTDARPHGGRLIVRFESVPDRTAAEGLRGVLLTVDSAALPPPADPEEFYDHQLVGLAAQLEDGTPVGVVSDVVHGPGGELLAIDRPDRDGAELLVPFVHAIVPTVDLAAGRLVLTPPPGLLDG
ncbi:MAG TPA: ribosome maturation factor RimM [Pseudonocardiaceae bacterium]